MKFSENTKKLIEEAQKKLINQFKEIDDIATFNQLKVLNAFQDNSVGLRHFSQTNGYGYDDIGRDTLCKTEVR